MFNMPNSLIVTDEDDPENGNAISIPTTIPRSCNKRLIYLRSEKIVYNSLCGYFDFTEVFSPINTTLTSGTYPPGTVDTHYFIILDEDQIEDFAYSFSYKSTHAGLINGEGLVFADFIEIGKFYSESWVMDNECNKSSGNNPTIRATTIKHNKYYGITPKGPTSFEVKIKAKANLYPYSTNWYITTMATEGDTLRLKAETADHDIDIVYQYSWYDIDNVESVPEYMWTTIGVSRDSIDFVVPEIDEEIESAIPKLWLRAYTKVNNVPLLGKSFGLVSNKINVYPKPRFEIDPLINYCYSEEGIDSIQLDSVEILPGLESIIFTLYNNGNPYPWKKTITESGSYLLKKSGEGNSNYIESGEYEILAENNWRNEAGDLFAAGHVVKTFTVKQRKTLENYLLKPISPTCYKDTYLTNIYVNTDTLTGVEVYYGGELQTQADLENFSLINGSNTFQVSYNTEPYCTIEDTINVVSQYPDFDFTPSQSQLCSYDKVYIKPNVVLPVSKDLKELYLDQMYFTVSGVTEPQPVTESIAVTTAGLKTVTVFFKKGGNTLCNKSQPFTVTLKPAISFLLSAEAPIGCNSALNGSIIISDINNAVATVSNPCRIKIKKFGATTYLETKVITNIPVVNSYTFSNLVVGKYLIDLIDGNGCTKSASITLTLNGAPFSVDTIITNPGPCSYSNNGSVQVIASGSGSSYYEVSRDGLTWQTSNTLSNYSQGSYSVYARPTLLGTGINECKIPLEVSFTAPNSVIITATVTQPTCSQAMGSIQLNGTTSYQKQLNGTWRPTTAFGYYNPGTYWFRGINSFGCTSSDTSVTIDSIPQISITNFAQVNPSCYGGFGSISFKIFEQIPTGQYTIKLNNEAVNVCNKGEEPADKGTKCFTLSNGVYSIGNLPEGSYNLAVTEGTLCSSSVNFAITQPEQLQITFEDLSQNAGYDIACAGGTVNFSVIFSGGIPFDGGNYLYTYKVNTLPTVSSSGNLISFEDVIANTIYKISATDKNGCMVNVKRVINEPEPLKLKLTDSTFASCPNIEDGKVTFEVSGGVLPYNLHYKTCEDCTEQINELTTAGSHDVLGLREGWWLFYMTDSIGCRIPSEDNIVLVELVNPDEMGIATTFSKPTCYNKNDGDITVKAIGRNGLEKVFNLYLDETLVRTDSTTSDSITFINLIAGNYSAEFLYADSCSVESIVTLTQPSQLTYTISSKNISCSGSNNGSVTVNVSGGTQPYKIVLFNSEIKVDSVILTTQSSFEFDSLSPGSFHIDLSDKNGCDVYPPAVTEVTISNPQEPIGILLSQTPVVCYETASGIITANASGGWGSYNYSIDGVNWIADDTLHIFTGLVDSTYNIFLKDLMGCEISQTIEVTQPDVLAIDSIVVDSVSCYGGANGSVSLTAMGGNGGYTWLFNNGTEVLPDSTVHNLTSKMYRYSVVDKEGCTVSDSIFVPQPNEFSIEFFTNSYDGYNIKCNGGTDSLWYSINGGNTPYSTLLNGANAGIANSGDTLVYTNLSQGKYVLSLTDRKGCLYNDSTVLVEPIALKIDSVIYTEPRCHGGNDGKIEVKVINGISPYIYKLEFDAETSWQNTSGIFNGLVADTFQLSVTDKYGCTIDSQLTLEQPEPVTLKVDTIIAVACKGGNTGYAVVLGEGGVGGYSFTWYNSNNEIVSNINSISKVSADNYLVNVWDGNGCNIAEQFPIQIPEPANYLAIDTIGLTQPNCFGESNGEIYIAATGGWGEFTYTLDGISNSEGKFIGLLANTLGYKIFISDLLNCKIDTTVILNQPDSLQLMLKQIQHITCNGDSTGLIKVEAVGGNAGYEYKINDIITNNTTGEFTDLTAGGYTILVNDSKGCVASLSDTITQPTAITYASADIIRPTCGNANGAITINNPSGGTGPISIDWDDFVTNTSFSIDSLPAGIYGFTLTDTAYCNVSFSETLSNIDGPVIDSIFLKNPTCSYRNDGEIKFKIIGEAAPFTVTWSGNGTWNPDSLTYSNVIGGIDTALVVDSNNCMTFQPFTLNAPPPISVNVVAEPVICFGENSGILTATVAGGSEPYSGGWEVGNVNVGFVANGLPSRSYALNVYDSNGCGFGNSDSTLAGNFEVSQPDSLLKIKKIDISQPKCFGSNNGSLTITASGGWNSYNYQISGQLLQNNPNFVHLFAGSYSVEVTDMLGCTVQDSVEVNQPQILDLQKISIQSVLCFGKSNGEIRVRASGGIPPFQYSNVGDTVSNGHGNFPNLSSANYIFSVVDRNGCNDMLNLFVPQPELLQASVDTILPAHCGSSDGEILLTAQGGNGLYRANWTGFESVSSLTLNSIPSGNYSATVVDKKNCISNQIYGEVPEIAGPTLVVGDIVSPLCSYSSNGSIQLSTVNGSAPFVYEANGLPFQNEKVDNISGGIYKLMVVDYFGCFDTVTVAVVAPQDLSIKADELKSPQCHNYSNGKIRISSEGGTLPHGYSWSNLQSGSTISALSAGSYTVTLTDNNNCTKQASFVLRNPAPIVVNLPEAVTLCAGQTSQFDAGNDGSQFWWFLNDISFSIEKQIEVSETGTYTLQITNPAGCFANDTVKVTKHNYEVDATFIIPSEAYVGDTIVAIDISWPIPDSLYWVIPNEFEIVESYLYEYLLKPKQVGNYSIGIVTYVGECSAYQQKSISVLPQQAAPLLPKEGLNDIFVSVSVAPNPAVNSTLLSVELSRIANLSISVHNAFGQKVKALSVLNGNSYRITIPVAAFTKGVYMIVLTAETSTRTIKLVVN